MRGGMGVRGGMGGAWGDGGYVGGWEVRGGDGGVRGEMGGTWADGGAWGDRGAGYLYHMRWPAVNRVPWVEVEGTKRRDRGRYVGMSTCTM